MKLAEFIKAHVDEINENNFTKVYEDLVDDLDSEEEEREIGKFTDMLIDAGINPLMYMMNGLPHWKSAKKLHWMTKQRIFRVLETAKEVYLNRKIHIGTSKLNEVMLPIIEAYPPQSVKGKYIKIKYCTQLPNTTIPSFVFYANLPQYVKENYRRFLENKIRDNWSLHGCPINVFIRQK